MKIVIGEGSCGIAAGAAKVYDALQAQLTPADHTKLMVTGCNGMCFLEPIVDVYDGKKLVQRLVKVKPEDAPAIAEAIRTGDYTGVEKLKISDEDQSFQDKQTRIVLRNCGVIDPTSIDAYLEVDGYKAIEKVLTTMTPEQVIEEIKISGLAGRGGAGFPTWFKWNAARSAKGDKKYLICNADEGDPGAFMDRAVIESDPHSLIEGMLVGAYAVAELPRVDRIPCVRFDEAKRLAAEKYGRPIRDPFDLEPEEEANIGRYFQEEYGADFVFVTHYPSKKRPFYAMDDPEDPRCTLSFDLLFRGMEVTTGGQRVHDYQAQVAKMEARGMHPEKFRDFLTIHQHGMPPHGGLGIGLERLTMKLCGLENVREASLFPRDQSRLEP